MDAVEFVQVPKDFKGIYHSHIEENQSSSVEVESDSGFGIVVMNAVPGRNSQIQRKDVRVLSALGDCEEPPYPS